MNPCMLHQKGGGRGASILHMRSMRPWLHLPHHTAHASYTPESILMLICTYIVTGISFAISTMVLQSPSTSCIFFTRLLTNQGSL